MSQRYFQFKMSKTHVFFPHKKKKEVGERRKEGKEDKEKGGEREKGQSRQALLFVLHPCHKAHDHFLPVPQATYLGVLLNTFFLPK